MNKFVPAAALILSLTAPAALAAEPEPKTDQDKTLYSLGLLIARNLEAFRLSPAELELVKAGITDGVQGKPKKADLETFGPKINDLAKGRAAAAAADEKKSGKAFLDKAAAEAGAVKTASGMVYKEIKAGTGAAPKPTDTVKVHYHGTLTDGTVFDSSVKRGQPAEFPLNGVIPCWTEGVGKMKVGGKARLVCPSELAYGDNGRPGIKPGATLNFEVELLEVKAPAPAATAPAAPAPKK
jgi:FKBP-type peptidyl-prolyl cis-trans isomerase